MTASPIQARAPAFGADPADVSFISFVPFMRSPSRWSYLGVEPPLTKSTIQVVRFAFLSCSVWFGRIWRAAYGTLLPPGRAVTRLRRLAASARRCNGGRLGRARRLRWAVGSRGACRRRLRRATALPPTLSGLGALPAGQRHAAGARPRRAPDGSR